MDYLKTIEYSIKPVSALKIIRNCAGCGRKTEYVSTGLFRVNANKKLVDVWLIYQCEKCKHTYNLSVIQRMQHSRIPKEQYAAFLKNDEEMALKYGTDLNVFKKNGAEIIPDQLEYQYEKIKELSEKQDGKTGAGHIRLILYNPYRLKIRIDKFLPELLDLSRSQVKKLYLERKLHFEGTYLGEITEVTI